MRGHFDEYPKTCKKNIYTFVSGKTISGVIFILVLYALFFKPFTYTTLFANPADEKFVIFLLSLSLIISTKQDFTFHANCHQVA